MRRSLIETAKACAPIIPSGMAGVLSFASDHIYEVDVRRIADLRQFFHAELDLAGETCGQLLLRHVDDFGNAALRNAPRLAGQFLPETTRHSILHCLIAIAVD